MRCERPQNTSKSATQAQFAILVFFTYFCYWRSSGSLSSCAGCSHRTKPPPATLTASPLLHAQVVSTTCRRCLVHVRHRVVCSLLTGGKQVPCTAGKSI